MLLGSLEFPNFWFQLTGDILINIEKSNLSLSTLQKKNENDYNNKIKEADKKIENDEFIKAIKGPQPWTSIMPTGGVEPTEESLKDWFNAGAFCVGIGSKLMIKESTGSYNYTEIEKLVKKCTSFIKELKVK